jgi:hypothetical protein
MKYAKYKFTIFLLCFLIFPYALYSITKSKAILNGRGEEKDEKCKKKKKNIFGDDMYSWSNMSRFELKENVLQKNVDFKNNT